MLKAILVSLAILSYIPASGQSKKSFEFSVLGRYDQANYVTRFGARSFNDTLKLYGMSYGATISYRQKIYKDISASIGIGYYRLGIDKIKGIGYYSVSQHYYLRSKSYSTNNRKPLEFGANITLGVLKKYKKFYIRPALIIPVYQNLKGDEVFYEDKSIVYI